MHKNVFLLMADCEGTLDEFIPILRIILCQ